MERSLDAIRADMIEQRVSRLELTLKTFTKELDVHWKHLTSLQAHLDHVAARVSRH